jgi:hypothetical protein
MTTPDKYIRIPLMLEGSGGLSYSMEPDSMYAGTILENIYLVYKSSGLFFTDICDERKLFKKNPCCRGPLHSLLRLYSRWPSIRTMYVVYIPLILID